MVDTDAKSSELCINAVKSSSIHQDRCSLSNCLLLKVCSILETQSDGTSNVEENRPRRFRPRQGVFLCNCPFVLFQDVFRRIHDAFHTISIDGVIMQDRMVLTFASRTKYKDGFIAAMLLQYSVQLVVECFCEGEIIRVPTAMYSVDKFR